MNKTNEDKNVLRAILFFFLLLLLTVINATTADEDMTSNLICPCECAMVISTCDCPTALQVKKEIGSMKQNGFSEKQIFKALQAEYGREIIHQEKVNSTLLWLAGISLAIVFGFVGYIVAKKPKPDITPDREKYEKRFEEEYRKFVLEMEEM